MEYRRGRITKSSFDGVIVHQISAAVNRPPSPTGCVGHPNCCPGEFGSEPSGSQNVSRELRKGATMDEIKGIARVKFLPGKLEEWKRLTAEAMEIVRTKD